MGNFEFDGAKYKNVSKHQKEWGNRIINELKIGEKYNILDLGCGDGVLTKELASIAKGGKTIGVDASEGMIRSAKDIEGRNLEFKVMDINNIKLEEQFDLIFSNAALHWVKDHNRLLNTCVKFLKANGQIRFNFAGDGNCNNFFQVVKEVSKSQRYYSYFKDFNWPWYMPSIDDYKELLSNVKGLEDIQVYGENADRYFKNEDELIGWIDQPSIVPFLIELPEDMKKEFRDIVVGKMVLKTKQNDGTCFETFRRINVIAKKG